MSDQPQEPGVSCITVQDTSPESRFIYASSSIVEVLGYEPHELVGMSPFDIIHPDEREAATDALYDALGVDRAAIVGFLRFKHKDGTFRPCQATWTVVTNCVISGIESTPEAPMSPNNVLRTTTAQDVMVFTPSARQMFSVQPWHRGSPQRDFKVPPRSSNAPPLNSLPERSIRQALILDRFSIQSPIQFCTVSPILNAVKVTGRSFFDFVSEKDEELVRAWINNAKASRVGGGVTTDTGFTYGVFELYPRGRKSKKPSTPLSPGRESRMLLSGSTRSTPSNAMEVDPSEQEGMSHGPSSPEPVTKRRQSKGRGEQVDALNGRTTMDAIFDTHSDGIIVILRHSKE